MEEKKKEQKICYMALEIRYPIKIFNPQKGNIFSFGMLFFNILISIEDICYNEDTFIHVKKRLESIYKFDQRL